MYAEIVFNYCYKFLKSGVMLQLDSTIQLEVPPRYINILPIHGENWLHMQTAIVCTII